MKVSSNINELAEKPFERLQGEDKDLFLNFCNAYDELMGEAESDSFITGFRMGVRFAYDTFCGDEQLYERLKVSFVVKKCAEHQNVRCFFMIE